MEQGQSHKYQLYQIMDHRLVYGARGAPSSPRSVLPKGDARRNMRALLAGKSQEIAGNRSANHSAIGCQA